MFSTEIFDPRTRSRDQRRHAARARKVMAATIALLLIVAVLGSVFSYLLISHERERALRPWQARLEVEADSRVDSLNTWMNDRIGGMRELAGEPAVQRLAQAGNAGKPLPADSPDVLIASSLLNMLARRDGFLPGKTEAGGWSVPTGVAILDTAGRVVLASPGLGELPPEMADTIADAQKNNFGLLDIQHSEEGPPILGFAIPIRPILATGLPGPIAGTVIGIHLADKDFYDTLVQPNQETKSGESYLVRASGKFYVYLSPLANNEPPLHRRIDVATAGLADTFAINKPGRGGPKDLNLRIDYLGHQVLLTGRPIPNTPWTLVRKVDQEEAQADANRHQRKILAVLLVGVFGSVALAAGLLRAGRAMSRNADAIEQLHTAVNFTQMVLDSHPHGLAVLSMDDRFIFVNHKAALDLGFTASTLVGKSLAEVYPYETARLWRTLNKQATDSRMLVTQIHNLEIVGRGGETSNLVLMTSHVPLFANGDSAGAAPVAVLMVTNDVTDVVGERQWAEQTLRQLVTTLVDLLDRRDPYTIHHSQQVARVAGAICRGMSLPPDMISTAEIAGTLMNVGKSLIPTSILAKQGPLSIAERTFVRDKMAQAAQMLAGVSFDDLVTRALCECYERWDGKGFPNGLKGEGIALPARVAAVANGFVSLISPRSYRDALPVDSALAQLRHDCGVIYDDQVVDALVLTLKEEGELVDLRTLQPMAAGSDIWEAVSQSQLQNEAPQAPRPPPRPPRQAGDTDSPELPLVQMTVTPPPLMTSPQSVVASAVPVAPVVVPPVPAAPAAVPAPPAAPVVPLAPAAAGPAPSPVHPALQPGVLIYGMPPSVLNEVASEVAAAQSWAQAHAQSVVAAAQLSASVAASPAAAPRPAAPVYQAPEPPPPYLTPPSPPVSPAAPPGAAPRPRPADPLTQTTDWPPLPEITPATDWPPLSDLNPDTDWPPLPMQGKPGAPAGKGAAGPGTLTPEALRAAFHAKRPR